MLFSKFYYWGCPKLYNTIFIKLPIQYEFIIVYIKQTGQAAGMQNFWQSLSTSPDHKNVYLFLIND